MDLGLKHYNKEGDAMLVQGQYHIPLSIAKSREDVSCPICGNTKISVHSKIKHKIVDLPIEGKPVKLIITKLRYRCWQCETTFVEPLPEIDEKRKMTIRALKALQKLIEKREISYTELSKQWGISLQTIRNILHSHSEADVVVNTYFKTPSVLGIHEIRLFGTYVTIFTNITAGTIINIIPKRNREVLHDYFDNMPDKAEVDYIFPEAPVFATVLKQNWPEFTHAKFILDKEQIVAILAKRFFFILSRIFPIGPGNIAQKNFHYVSAMMLAAGDIKRRSDKLEDLIYDTLAIYYKEAPHLEELYQEYKALNDLIHNPSEAGLAKLHNHPKKVKDITLSMRIQSLRRVVINFKKELLSFDNYKIPNSYKNNIQTLGRNLKILNDTSSLAKFWNLLQNNQNVKGIHGLEDKLAHDYHHIKSHQNDGIDIEILNEVFSTYTTNKI